MRHLAAAIGQTTYLLGPAPEAAAPCPGPSRDDRLWGIARWLRIAIGRR
ncbi:hypothetical protein [Nonomuraea typhae]|uniref:Uncharacterized protein n=1 Tax=Nonomuraea typhae TaxID=2603600 RepID=A0ABW7YR87_9ACTN